MNLLIVSVAVSALALIATVVCAILWWHNKNQKYQYPFILAVLFGFIFVISVPFLINEAYKTNAGYITMWHAEDMLSFYGSFLAFSGTVLLGSLAFWQNKQLQKINQEMQIANTSRPFFTIEKIELKGSGTDNKLLEFDKNNF